MKKFSTLILAGTLLLALVSCATVTSRANAVVNQGVPAGVLLNADVAVSKLTNHPNGFTGGWTKNDSLQVDDMAREAFAKATATMAGQYRPVALEATQVVAGLNYCFLSEVLQNGKVQYQLIYIYRDLTGGASVTKTENL